MAEINDPTQPRRADSPAASLEQQVAAQQIVPEMAQEQNEKNQMEQLTVEQAAALARDPTLALASGNLATAGEDALRQELQAEAAAEEADEEAEALIAIANREDEEKAEVERKAKEEQQEQAQQNNQENSFESSFGNDSGVSGGGGLQLTEPEAKAAQELAKNSQLRHELTQAVKAEFPSTFLMRASLSRVPNNKLPADADRVTISGQSTNEALSTMLPNGSTYRLQSGKSEVYVNFTEGNVNISFAQNNPSNYDTALRLMKVAQVDNPTMASSAKAETQNQFLATANKVGFTQVGFSDGKETTYQSTKSNMANSSPATASPTQQDSAATAAPAASSSTSPSPSFRR